MFGRPSQQRVAELYRRHGPAIYARCRKLLRDDALAEDATQETFIRVVKHLDDAPPDDALKWIYRIATNYCLNELRNARRRPEPMDTLPDRPGPDAEAHLADRGLARALVERSPEKCRTVAWLYHVDGLEQQEVADTLGISRRTVVTRLQEFHAFATAFRGDGP